MKYLSLLFLIFLSVSCELINGKKTDCITDYIFEIPMSVSPSNDILKVGDTLIVSMVNDNTQLYDSYGERIVNFPNFDPNAWFLMPLLDSFPVKDGFIENEILIKSNYTTKYIFASTLSYGLFFKTIDTSEIESKLDFKVILKKPGIYALYVLSGIWRNSDDACFPNKCNGCGYSKGEIIGEFKYTSMINDNILTDIHLSNEDKYWKERAGGRRRSRPYYFKVVE